MLLGEQLIGFRTTSGDVGLMQNSCPHRGASMFFGRNEEEGLRCVYHGWKFDTTGACVDMPSEPAESNFRTRSRRRAYPTHERNGIIWAYMGPREVPPPLPDIEANTACARPAPDLVLHRPCNWMQGWEGEMDTVHAAFLHGGAEQRRGLRARQLQLLPVPPARRQVQSPSRPSTAFPTAPTVPPRPTATTGASPTCSSPSTT